MARKPFNSSKSVGYAGSKSPIGSRVGTLKGSSHGSSSMPHYPRRNNVNGKNRFGTQEISNPMMIEDIFGVRYDYVGRGLLEEATEDPYYEADSNAMYDEGPYQLEFNFKTTDELEYDLRHAIAKYEYAIERMGEYAVNWHYLMEDLEANPHLAKMFMDIQTMRKLGGGGVPS